MSSGQDFFKKKYGLRTEESYMQNDATIPLYLSTWIAHLDLKWSKTAKATSMRELVVKVKWPPQPYGT